MKLIKICIMLALIFLVDYSQAEAACRPINNKNVVIDYNNVQILHAAKNSYLLNNAWQSKEICRWAYAIDEAVTLFLPDYLKKIKPFDYYKKMRNPVSFVFYINNRDPYTALAGDPVSINLRPDHRPFDWIKWDLFVAHGFTRLEMVYVILHETTHLFDFNHLEDEEPPVPSELDLALTSYEAFVNEGAVTLYGKAMGAVEDFAESGALYVMWPDYLKQNFPEHYDSMKKIFGKEFPPYRCMPRSIKSRLIKPFEVSICQE